jgi:hypothetical protein
MRIERAQHAVDGILDELLLLDRLDIVAADALQHVAEQVELLIELALVAAGGLRIGLGLRESGSGQESHGRGE